MRNNRACCSPPAASLCWRGWRCSLQPATRSSNVRSAASPHLLGQLCSRRITHVCRRSPGALLRRSGRSQAVTGRVCGRATGAAAGGPDGGRAVHVGCAGPRSLLARSCTLRACACAPGRRGCLVLGQSAAPQAAWQRREGWLKPEARRAGSLHLAGELRPISALANQECAPLLHTGLLCSVWPMPGPT